MPPTESGALPAGDWSARGLDGAATADIWAGACWSATRTSRNRSRSTFLISSFAVIPARDHPTIPDGPGFNNFDASNAAVIAALPG